MVACPSKGWRSEEEDERGGVRRRSQESEERRKIWNPRSEKRLLKLGYFFVILCSGR